VQYKMNNRNLSLICLYGFLAHFPSIWKKMRVLWAVVLSVRPSVRPSVRLCQLITFHNFWMVHRSLVGLFTLDQGAPEDDFKLLGFGIGLRASTPEVKKAQKGLKTVKNQFLII
jgi:hypothetical protein